jgi:hypothetical protein
MLERLPDGCRSRPREPAGDDYRHGSPANSCSGSAPLSPAPVRVTAGYVVCAAGRRQSPDAVPTGRGYAGIAVPTCYPRPFRPWELHSNTSPHVRPPRLRSPAVPSVTRRACCATSSPTAARSRGTALPGRLVWDSSTWPPRAHGRWSAFADSLHKPPPKSHRRHNVDRQLCIRGHMTCSHVYAQQRPSRCARCSIISALVGVLAVILRAGLLAVCRKVRWTACHAIPGQGVSLGDGRAIPSTLRFRRQTGTAAVGCRDADGAAHQR